LTVNPDTLVRPIGVFDSGVGGLSILRALRAELPQEDWVYFADSGHAPYGERDDAHVVGRSRAITQQLRDAHHIKALVIACNTATAAAVQLLRAEHPDLPIIGVEPALKPAVAASQTRRIGVMATRGTLSSAKFQTLLQSQSSLADFVLQPCDGLADAIEHQDSDKVNALCARYAHELGRFGTADGHIDTVVLGCTHYPFAQETLRALLGPQVQFLETGEPVARHTHQLLKTRAIALQNADHKASLTLLSSGSTAMLEAAAARWLPDKIRPELKQTTAASRRGLSA